MAMVNHLLLHLLHQQQQLGYHWAQKLGYNWAQGWGRQSRLRQLFRSHQHALAFGDKNQNI
jgi:hypothetical protein